MITNSELLKRVTELLPSFGYKHFDKDNGLLKLAIETVIERVKAYTNQKMIPDGLLPEMQMMIVGEFLYLKKQFGGLDEGGISFPARITQYTEGDTSISFGKTDKTESDFDRALDYMRYGNPSVIEHYRKIHWHS